MKMASIRFHGDRWQARVRRKGFAVQSRSFLTHADAQRWARSLEIEMDRGTFVSATEANKTTLGDLIERYRREVTPTMKSARDDLIRLAAIQRNSLCRTNMASLTSGKVAKYRDERLKCVSAGTVIRELAYLSAIINHARREWGIHVVNPVALVRRPESPKGRSRVLTPEERERLLEALKPIGRRSVWMLPLVTLALETAMRRGELLALTWANVDLRNRLAVLDDTKNGDRRLVPLSSQAVAALNAMPRSLDGRVFPMSFFSVAAAFGRALVRADLEDLRFHDLRHTAITAMAEKLPNLIELAAVSGHKSLKMLQRYYHPSVQDLARKLG
jgi:integrase